MNAAQQAWEAHLDTCPQCSKAEPGIPFCEEGFKLLQASMKEAALQGGNDEIQEANN